LEFLSDYGLFLAKTVTVLIAFIIVMVVLSSAAHQRRGRVEGGQIEVLHLNDGLDQVTDALKQMVYSPELLKQEQKQKKKQDKEDNKARKQLAKTDDPDRKPRVYVIDFEGDVEASAVSQLREEVTAVLSLAEPMDEVVVRVESPGGMVHSYGLAASQLKRIVGKNIPLTIAVDKVAASGGYMMACIGTRIIAAPFALLGSIGVVAQLPNFHRLLEKNEIDYDVYTAGQYKRTVTVFGENTEEGKSKFVEELEDVHVLFKDFVGENRPQVDVDVVSTGEAWYGTRALELKLVDELMTSDEYLVDRCQQADVYRVKYHEHKKRIDKLMDRLAKMTGRGPFDVYQTKQHIQAKAEGILR